VFGDICDRLPEVHKLALAALQPRKGATKEQAAEAYEMMERHLLLNLKGVFNHSNTSPCLRHPGQLCHVEPEVTQEPNVNPPLRLTIAGAMCTPWSSMGSGRGLADPATKAWHVWSTERRARREDLIFLENAPEFPLKILEKSVASTHDIKSVIFGSKVIGWPIDRVRLWACCINRSELVWLGPEEPDAVASEFLRLRQAKCILDADVFAGIDSEANAKAQLHALAQNRGCYLKDDIDLSKVDIRSLLTPSARQRYDKYQGIYVDLVNKGQAGGAFVADLSQDPVFRNRSGQTMCTLMKNTMLYSFSRKHLFSPHETCVAHGWPAVPGLCGMEPPPWMAPGGALCIKESQLRALCGTACILLACVLGSRSS
jgi:hypothetical protein